MKTAVLLSGGVDSSVALGLLAREGRDSLTAFYLKIWLEDDLAGLGDCPWEEDLSYARDTCAALDVPLQIISLQTEYHARVVAHALRELRAGRTPSPDILCNQFIKFGAFYDRIDPGFAVVATGHYARVRARGDRRELLRAPDPVKDQTYFLSRLSQAQLRRAAFPIGHLMKSQVRDLAAAMGLPTQSRRDSQGICFLGKIRYPEFVRFHLGERAGAIVDIDTGTQLGTHNGFWFHTIGQRQGLGLSGGPWYVVGKDVDENIVYVSHAERYRARVRNSFVVEDLLHWIAGGPPAAEARLQLKLRHGPARTDCTLSACGSGRSLVTMSEADPGVAPGQSSVFYDGDVCLGSGVIREQAGPGP